MAALVLILAFLIPPPSGMATLPERITFALQLNVIAALPLFIMFVTAPRTHPQIHDTGHVSPAAADLGAMIVTARRETSLARL